MNLHSLSNTPGARQRRKRVGCGPGSGRGKTSTRGHKGQHARSGSSIRPGFESGHIPLYRKLPHRGFNNARFRRDYQVVNLSDLKAVEGDSVDREGLLKLGLIRKTGGPVKILANGEITRALTVSADAFSAGAKAKLEAAGGKAVTPEPVKTDKENAE